LPSARVRAPGKDFKKIFFAGCLPDRALGKENTKKVKNSLPSATMVQHPANKLYKKIKIFAGCLADTALGKENTKKNKKLFVECPRCAAPGKENLKKIKKSLPGASDIAPGKARANGAALSRSLFFAGCRVCTRQSLCRVPDKKHPAKKSLPTNFLPEALCRVQSSLCRRLNPVVLLWNYYILV
jgi:hypothetical protein